MTPELEEVLDGIGWQVAKVYNRSLFFLAWEPTKDGGLLFRSKPDAREGINNLLKLEAALKQIPPTLHSMLSGVLRTSEDWDSGRNPMEEFELGLAEAINIARHEQDKLWTGAGPNAKQAARKVADQMAEIYVLGMGKLPTSGTKPDNSNEPSTQFSRAVRDVYRLLDIDAHFMGPCERAVAALEADDGAGLKRLYDIRNKAGGFRFTYSPKS